MANKPANLCELQKDKFIGGQEGFVDTFNWATQAINNIEGGKNCKVDWTIPDHPVINVDIPESEGGEGLVSAVYDVVASTSGSQSGIGISYVDDRAETFIPFPRGAGGSVTFRGTDMTFTSAATTFYINNASNSNVVVTANG